MVLRYSEAHEKLCRDVNAVGEMKKGFPEKTYFEKELTLTPRNADDFCGTPRRYYFSPIQTRQKKTGSKVRLPAH